MAKLERRWSPSDFSELLAGMRDPETLRTLDSTGMTPSISAILHAAEKVFLLMALLDTVEAGGAESAITRIEVLLQEVVQNQKIQIEQSRALVALLSTRAARQAQLDQARAEEDAAIEAAREEAKKLKMGRNKPVEHA